MQDFVLQLHISDDLLLNQRGVDRMTDSEFRTEANFSIIKGKLKAVSTSSFGVFVAFMDNVTKTIDRFDIICSHFSTIFENNVNMPWNELEELIQQMKWKGEYATNLTHDAQSTMEDLFEPGTGRVLDIWQSLKKNQYNKTESIFEEYLMRPTGDKNIKVEIGVETVSGTDIDRVKMQREQKANQEQAMLNEPATPLVNTQDNAVILDIALVLSPISGVSLSELKPGEKILVKISEQSNRGQYFIDLLGAQVEGEIVPVPATVEKVIMAEKLNTVIVSIGPGIYGKALEEDNVKAKRYDPAKDKRQNKAAPQQLQASMAMNSTPAGNTMINPENEEGGNKNLIFLIIGGLALLMIIILIFLMIA